MIIIRPMQEFDIDTVFVIEQLGSPPPWVPWGRHVFVDCLRVGYFCWVLAEENTPVGFGLLSVTAEEGHVLNFVVHPRLRRQGLGRRMMSHLLKQAWHA